MPKESNKILKYYDGEKSMKVSFIIYAYMESFLEKISTCYKNLKNSSNVKYIPSSCLLFTHCASDSIKNKFDCYRGHDFEKVLLSVKTACIKINNYIKKEMIPLTYKGIKSYKKQNVCYICKKRFSSDDKNDNKDTIK